MLTRPNTVLDTIISTLNEYISKNPDSIKADSKLRGTLETMASIVYDYTETVVDKPEPQKKLKKFPEVNNGNKNKNDKLSVKSVDDTLDKLKAYLDITNLSDKSLATEVMKNINEGRVFLKPNSASAAATKLPPGIWKKSYEMLDKKSKEIVYVAMFSMIPRTFGSVTTTSKPTLLTYYNRPQVSDAFDGKTFERNMQQNMNGVYSSEKEMLDACVIKFTENSRPYVSYLFKVNMSKDEFMKLLKEDKSDKIFEKIRVISCINSMPDDSGTYVYHPLEVKLVNGKFVEDVKPDNKLTRSPK